MPSSPAIVRLTADADLDDVAALEAASFSHPWSRDMLARELQNTNVSRIYAARDGVGSLVAFCACWFLADELHINTLAVRHSERRRGCCGSSSAKRSARGCVGRRWKCADRTMPPSNSTRGWGSRSEAFAGITTTIRWKTRSCSGASSSACRTDRVLDAVPVLW